MTKYNKPIRLMKIEISPEDVRALKIQAIKHGWTLQKLLGVIVEKWVNEKDNGGKHETGNQ